LKREQAVLKVLFAMIALMFTTTAFAQEQCKSTKWDNSTEGKGISDINRILARIMDRVEPVPPEEADYIRKELELAEANRQLDRITPLHGRRYYASARLRDAVAKAMREVEAAQRATMPKDVARHLIETLSSTIPHLYETSEYFVKTDNKREQHTMSIKDRVDMGMDIAEARFVAADILQCIVKSL
jgi:hypothetical protein